MDDKVNCKILKMSRPVTRGTPASKEEDKDEETVNTKKRPPAQEEENSPKKKWNQLKNTQKEDYLRGLLNEQFPPARLDDLHCRRVQRRLRDFITTTNEDGSLRYAAPTPPVRVPTPELTCAVASDLDPYKDYTSTASTTAVLV